MIIIRYKIQNTANTYINNYVIIIILYNNNISGHVPIMVGFGACKILFKGTIARAVTVDAS